MPFLVLECPFFRCYVRCREGRQYQDPVCLRRVDTVNYFWRYSGGTNGFRVTTLSTLKTIPRFRTAPRATIGVGLPSGQCSRNEWRARRAQRCPRGTKQGRERGCASAGNRRRRSRLRPRPQELFSESVAGTSVLCGCARAVGSRLLRRSL